jgi:hypothetical protein
VEKALAQLKNIQEVASSPEARAEIRAMLAELDCRIGLGFVGAIKGKKRPVRKLAAGIIVFGDGELPVKLHGKDRIVDGADVQDDCGDGHHGDEGDDDSVIDFPTSCSRSVDTAQKCNQAITDINTNEGRSLPSTTDVFFNKCHQEEVSLTKVNRADRI